MSVVTTTAPRVEHTGEALGIGTPEPRLSWTNSAEADGWVQQGYELSLRSGEAEETRQVQSSEQVLVPWPFTPLQSRQVAEVRVRTRGDDGAWSAWSEPTVLEAGLLASSDFTAKLIGPATIGGLDDPAPVLETTFSVREGGPDSARLYLTAHGIYLVRINGERVGDHVLAPGWSSYQHRLLYQTFDVTEHLQPGENTIEVTLGNGWFRGNLGRPPRRDLYGDRLGVLAQLEVSYADGASEVVTTDESWTARDSHILRDDLYNGQTTDLTGGATVRTDPVTEQPFDPAVLTAQSAPPVRVIAEIPAVEVFASPSGRVLVDFGQNIVGWVRLTVRNAEAGSTVVVRHAEVLEHGELGTRPLRTAEATDRYHVAGVAEEVLEPELTFHGFRYAEVEGVAGLDAGDLTAVVISSDLERLGQFECSDDRLNRLHDNVIRGMQGNFVALPTDCPQRDERLGWTGDIQVFAPTASFLFHTAGFLESWLADLAAEQGPDGSVPYVIPDVFRRATSAAAAWGDAATVVPWVLYLRYGDRGILERQFDSMRGWVDKMDALAGEDHLWIGGFQYGDWLDPSAPPDDPAAATTSHDLVATAHLAQSARIVAQAAQVLGRHDEAERYGALAAATREAFAAEFSTPAARLTSDSQTAYSLAILWDLLPSGDAVGRAGQRLTDLVRRAGFTIGTGFVGTPLILDALSEVAEVDLAYRMLQQEECPSWLYAITMGATTIWERWDSMLPDGTINPGQMTSFNHYAFGAVADWMHRAIAGLAPAEPGYRRLLIRPLLGGQLTSASAEHLTPFGKASVRWSRDGDRFDLRATVPTGTTAEVHLPGSPEPVHVVSGSHSWQVQLPPAAPSTGSAPATVRECIDNQQLWSQIVEAVRQYRPEWSDREVSKAAGQYLDEPVRELARIVGRSTIIPDEVALGREIDELVATAVLAVRGGG